MTAGSWAVVGPAVSRSGIGDLFSRSEHSSVGWSVGSCRCPVEPVCVRARRRFDRRLVASRASVPRRLTPRSRRPCRPGPRCRRRSATESFGVDVAAASLRRDRGRLGRGAGLVLGHVSLVHRVVSCESVPRSGIHSETRPSRPEITVDTGRASRSGIGQAVRPSAPADTLRRDDVLDRRSRRGHG